MSNNIKVNKIGIIMYGLLGDILMRTPIVHVLKQKYPNAKVYAFVDPIGKSVLEFNDNIDEIIITDRSRKNKLSYIKNKIKTQWIVRSLKLDMIINLYGGNSAHNMMKLSGAKYQIGFKDAKLWTNSEEIRFDQKKIDQLSSQKHLTYKLYPILSFLDIDFGSLSTRPLLSSDITSDNEVKNYIQKFPNFENEYYLISLGSGGLEKLVSMEKMYLLIDFIYKQYGLKPAVILNPGQEFLQDELINKFLEPNNIPHVKLDLLSISQITSLMKISQFIVVPDTGLFHMSVAVQIPLFSIFAYTNPQLVEPESGKYTLCHKLIEEKDAFGLNKCTKEISFEEISESFKEFYKLFKNGN